jgi:hypothetical protein
MKKSWRKKLINLTIKQALSLIELLDENLKRTDFKSFNKVGVDFSGYVGTFGERHSGCSKVSCMTSIVKYLMGESMGPDPDLVIAWLDGKVPGWQKRIGL